MEDFFSENIYLIPSILLGSLLLFFYYLHKSTPDYQYWKDFTQINIPDENIGEKAMLIYTLNNYDFRDEFKYLNDRVKRTPHFVLDNELKKYNYTKFDIGVINHAHTSLIQNLIRESFPKNLIVQNMSKPRDYFELVASLLVNEKKAKINILITTIYLKYGKEEFTIENILRTGSHIFFNKRNERSKIQINRIEQYGDIILIGDQKNLENLLHYCDIKCNYFHIRLYKTNTSVKYGVTIIENPLDLNELTLFYIGQLRL